MTSDALTYYVKTHDMIFSQQGTFMSLLRNTFGRGTDFVALCDQARETDEVWSEVERYCETNFIQYRDLCSEVERDFFEVLIPYIKAVKTTTHLLLKRQEALLQKRNNQPLKLSEYKKIDIEYEESIKAYLKCADALQPKTDRLLQVENNHNDT